MDIEHLLALIEALDRADHHAIGVFASEAWLGNNVSHRKISPLVEAANERVKWMVVHMQTTASGLWMAADLNRPLEPAQAALEASSA
jgi:hypothetical protein